MSPKPKQNNGEDHSFYDILAGVARTQQKLTQIQKKQAIFCQIHFLLPPLLGLGSGGAWLRGGKGLEGEGGIKGSYYMKKPCYKRSGRKYEMSDKWEDFVLDLRRLWRGRKQINPRTRISNNTT